MYKYVYTLSVCQLKMKKRKTIEVLNVASVL